MDLRQSKPIHIKCPKCGNDFGVNGNKIVSDLQFQKNRIRQLEKALADLKANNVSPKSPQYKRVLAQKADCLKALTALKNVNRNLTENAELEKFRVFYKLVKKELGEEKTLKLIKEAEEDIVYRDYDMAIQKHTNFEGV